MQLNWWGNLLKKGAAYGNSYFKLLIFRHSFISNSPFNPSWQQAKGGSHLGQRVLHSLWLGYERLGMNHNLPPYSHQFVSFIEVNLCLTFLQKFVMAGSSSQFVPSLNAITSNQDLQWLVQPSLMHSPGPSRSPVPPYPGLSGVRSLGPSTSQSHLLRPGVIRAAAHTTGLTRRRADEHVSIETVYESLTLIPKTYLLKSRDYGLTKVALMV